MELYTENITQQADGRASESATFNALMERQTGNKLLTEKTQQFVVNSTLLPHVNFGVGESDTGLLPFDSSNGSELLFWFLPSTNEAAKEEVAI
ncbi:putative Serine carboxypeptidase [Seiridium cardinale]